MSRKAFIDTCVAIGFTFFLNSHHSKAIDVFSKYDEYFWSSNVHKEYMRRYGVKLKNQKKFWGKLRFNLGNSSEFYSEYHLKSFALNNFNGKLKEDAESSIRPFWDKYIGILSRVSFEDLMNAIEACIEDLKSDTNDNRIFLEESLQLVEDRKNDYPKLDYLLKTGGVSDEDRLIALDGHEFASHSPDPVDFITFDDLLFKGVCEVEILCFESVKGKYDFN